MHLRTLAAASLSVGLLTSNLCGQSTATPPDKLPPPPPPPPTAAVEIDVSAYQEARGTYLDLMVYVRPRLSFEELLRPDFRRSDLRLLGETLTLDDEQTAVLKMMLEEYRQRFEAACEELREAIDGVEVPQGEAATALASERSNSSRSGGSSIVLSGGRIMNFARDDATVVTGRLMLPDVAPTIEVGAQWRQLTAEDVAEIEYVEARAQFAEAEADLAQARADAEAEAAQVAEAINALLEARAAEEEQNRRELAELEKLARKTRAEKQRLRTQLLEELRLILQQWQREFVPDALDLVRCTDDLSRGTLSGESINVAQVLRRLGTVQMLNKPLYQEAIDDWFTQCAIALRRRTGVLIDHEIEQIELLLDEYDADDWIDRARRVANARTDVRDCNLRAIAAATAQLSHSDAQRAQVASDLKGFPRIFKPTSIGRALKAALELPDAEPDVMMAIDALVSEYHAALTPLNELLKQSTVIEEPKRRVEQLEFTRKLRSVESKVASNPEADVQLEFPMPQMMHRTNELYERRNTLDQQMWAPLRALLTDTQLNIVTAAMNAIPSGTVIDGPVSNVIQLDGNVQTILPVGR